MPRSRSGFVRATRSRRIMKWGLGPGDTAGTAISGTGQQILGSGVVLATSTQLTLIRLRGIFHGFLKTGAADAGFQMAVGVGLVTNEAFAVGATAVPGPISEADWDGWMYHRFVDIHQATATFDGGEANSNFDIEVDTKAMRKWSEGYTLLTVLETVENGTATGTVFFDSRLLVKLP